MKGWNICLKAIRMKPLKSFWNMTKLVLRREKHQKRMMGEVAKLTAGSNARS